MLQRLLTERFHLVVHREPRPTDVYELVVGTGGHKMRDVEPADELDKKFPVGKVAEQFGTAADTVQDTPDGPVRTVMTGDDLGRTTITPRTMHKVTRNVERRTQTIDATRITMAELAALLTTNMNQPVVDKTDLRGLYQFGSVQLPLPAREIENLRRSPFRAGATLDLSNISESKAIEAIGLRLERRRSPIEVVVVDSIDRTPTDN